MNHSIKFPLPLNFHIGFVIFSVIMLTLCYKRRKYAYDLYMLIGIASTMLIYIAEPKPVFYALGLEEIILLIMTIVDMIIVARRNDAAEKAREEREEQTAMEVLENAALYDASDDAVLKNAASIEDVSDMSAEGASEISGKSALPEDISEFVGTDGSLSSDTIIFESTSNAVPEKPEETEEKEKVSDILYPYEPEPESAEATEQELSAILY
ncbi:MAG: hypothetical protein K2K57_15025, partial [Oscillospiraceae bacterium]|nr:hypothetical protein [Oscillospiraceae bacterium]